MTMPSIVSLSRSDAECLLSERELRWSVDGEALTSQPRRPCPPGAIVPDPPVVTQSPKPGVSIPHGATVRFTTRCFRRLCL